MKEDKYKLGDLILKDGDKFEVQEEEPNTNPYNPSGIGVYTFNHKSFKCEKL